MSILAWLDKNYSRKVLEKIMQDKLRYKRDWDVLYVQLNRAYKKGVIQYNTKANRICRSDLFCAVSVYLSK